MTNFSKNIASALVLVLMIVILGSCAPKKETSANSSSESLSLAVFVPGVLSGSPTYEMMDAGVRKAAAEKGIPVKTVEGGFNQAEWKSKVLALASEKKYDLIITSNPSMPEICREIKNVYPDQDFLILEGSSIENDTVSTFLFSHLELSYLMGYFAGLATRSNELSGANNELKAGLIAGQEYPEMMQRIKPGFIQGLKAAAGEEAELDFRVIGNWYDAAKASDLASSMYDDGVDIILTIAGGANQGVVTAAKEKGKYVLWYDTNGYSIAPGVILGSGVIREDKAAYEQTLLRLEGNLEPGSSVYAGVNEGYLDFIDDDPLYIEHVPEALRNSMAQENKKLRQGTLLFR
ncbi:BMP family ABC transporter substrate-binding protein [Oceanispirochaeta crateris]|uniref:BMP family ABC transporter substrate-binding protein n=1 Tax=Oceanispirochaeta crateris TaxID=2518645 RepID=A0A5C1QMX8_9SPIO|nr:BMP family ABC transporter substrate-binding protein [Oceanispirochaeta crateris]QEN08579.1 BMP family ABC transporter substrate-binding protein [Oceanispirochaeta crateris]